MVGDGEAQEGQVWETIHVAPRYGVGNLTLILDWNGMQQYGWALEAGEAHRGNRRDPWTGVGLRAALEAFGWRVTEIDGHDMGAIVTAGEAARAAGEHGGAVPTAILAHTTKGRGISFTEGRSEWHARPATAEEAATARRELTAGEDGP
jgi:transketolase